jgi:hypothetical protein
MSWLWRDGVLTDAHTRLHARTHTHTRTRVHGQHLQRNYSHGDVRNLLAHPLQPLLHQEHLELVDDVVF